MAKTEFVLGAALLAIITMLVFIASVMRFFNNPLIWSVDLAQLLFILAVLYRRDQGHCASAPISVST